MGKCGGLRFFRSKTVTHIVGKCGCLTSYPRKTLTTVEGNCGGGWLRGLKTVNHDGVWYGSVAPPLTTLNTYHEKFWNILLIYVACESQT